MAASEQLILEAKALGFDESAKSHDVLAEAQKRLAETSKSLAVARGSGSIEDVAKLTAEQEKLSQTVGLLSGTTERASLSSVNFGEALRRIHPLLGDAASALSRYSGAAAITGVAIAAITAAVKAMRDEYEKTTQAIRNQTSALNESKGKERETQQNIENIRAGTKLGSFRTYEQSAAANVRFSQVRSQYGFIDEGATAEAVALASGGSFDVEDTARIARMMEIPRMRASLGIKPNTSAENIVRRLQRGLTRNKAELDATFSLESMQKMVGRAMASGQVTTMGGSTLELQEEIGRGAPAGANLPYLAELTQEVGSLENLDVYESRMQAGFGVPGMVMRGIGATVPGANSPIWRATPQDFSILRSYFMRRRKQFGGPSRAPAEHPHRDSGGVPSQLYPSEPHSSAGQGEVHHHYDQRSFNARNYGPDGFSQRRRTVNGDTRARAMES